jgi:hypothetical protein
MTLRLAATRCIRHLAGNEVERLALRWAVLVAYLYLALVNPNGGPRPMTVDPHPHLLAGGQSLSVNFTLPRRRTHPARRRLPRGASRP